jgi:hypothetical protein
MKYKLYDANKEGNIFKKASLLSNIYQATQVALPDKLCTGFLCILYVCKKL